MNRIITYYRIAREELFKVIFPTKVQMRNALVSVVVVVVVVALFLALVDIVLFASVSKFVGD